MNRPFATLTRWVYRGVLRPVFFRFDSEKIHNFLTARGAMIGRYPAARQLLGDMLKVEDQVLEQTVCGIDFKNPIGLSAGFDYDAVLPIVLPAMSFGFGTVGTITNRPYEGNLAPRLGRLIKSRSLVVNKGFKNNGIDSVIKKHKDSSFEIPIGISIGKTNSTESMTQVEAVADVVEAFRKVESASASAGASFRYYELNISCPNLHGNVEFYSVEHLRELLSAVTGLSLSKPLFIKMPIDKTDEEVLAMIETIVTFPVQGVIFGNLQRNRKDPTIDQKEVAKYAKGNFSGKPTESRSNELISLAYKNFGKKMIIIGSGGVSNAEDAYKKIRLGASLVQLITGLIYEGPQLVSEINSGLARLLKQDGFASISEAVGTQRQYIKNHHELATTKERIDTLTIIESGLQAIDTKRAVARAIKVSGEKGNLIQVTGQNGKSHVFDLNIFKNVYIIGFGKSSCTAIGELERILNTRISGGVSIDKHPGVCELVKMYTGSHPVPSAANVDASSAIVELAKTVTADDLVIVVVSGGGSSMLCYPQSECDQGKLLYDLFLKSGGTISELNTVRKHISSMKGGGLVKLLQPATILSLVFCDIPGGNFEDVASGPTYFDRTTIADAQVILKKYGITEKFSLIETPKDKGLFDKVTNIPLVSNENAVIAMMRTAKMLGYSAISAGIGMYEKPEDVVKTFVSKVSPHTVVVGGGEPSLVVPQSAGNGGRNLHTTLTALRAIGPDDTFASFASDGIDNVSKYAGALVDGETKNQAKIAGKNIEESLSVFDSEGFFEKVGGAIETGPTGSNASDLMILLRK